jgi:hypothetical protein
MGRRRQRRMLIERRFIHMGEADANTKGLRRETRGSGL